ncbi:MAG: hypothetical protein COS82_03770 [Zetaproteobacteria bacterium CG06_land_8_20_14_3_00_59_53]|nr:MAG: hypothetical protein AUK36_00025 [Zetaproteobacteria bacterium CG2_30_59_37]PIO89631.1 MAG: hypothetical protein COX56_07305 [Zetaproteobacteria bacterium CG23_combo_of_CG06-09_8_20_14_all_59_86]PIQ65859.1 MAG: hypothetical protein COV97_02240 [Zetaproteobacteria bacterium CG11_big_fil_rev_8_21_14_0_20_59_439]PIU71012.1 MAG: hypothetical protein COS82_03770 [Zetaproteobacteria bacterium CG06_land_8_20_14_3_00_59_53]PIU97168.1 MAG: hypothetical protein COS62_05600 [Zetaproteobacteria bac
MWSFLSNSVALYELFSVTFETSYLSFLLDWIAFLILGYFQWFKLLPYIIGKLRKDRLPGSDQGK